jgi:hypothetical protein
LRHGIVTLVTPHRFAHAVCMVLLCYQEAKGEDKFSANDGYDFDSSNVLRLLGYFSMIGLLRVHCLIGDYHGGLKVFNAGSSQGGLLTLEVSCRI